MLSTQTLSVSLPAHIFTLDSGSTVDSMLLIAEAARGQISDGDPYDVEREELAVYLRTGLAAIRSALMKLRRKNAPSTS